MTKKILYFFGFLLIILSACTDNMESVETDASGPFILIGESDLTGLTSFENSGVIPIYRNADKLFDVNGRDDDDDDDDDGDNNGFTCQYTLTVVFTVDPPLFEGTELLSATDIHIEGRYAYISYNKIGPDYRGALDIIDMDDPDNPQLTARLYYANADLNSVLYKDGYVYAGGGIDADLLETAESYSFVSKIPVIGDQFDISDGINYGFQDGNTTTDIVVEGGKIFTSSGIEGYLCQFSDSDFSLTTEVPSPDLRALAHDNGNLVALEADMGVKVFDMDLNLIKDIPIESDFLIDAKRNLDLFGDRLLVAEGQNGAGMYSLSSGGHMGHITIPFRPPGVLDSDIVTNAVTSSQNMILMANGGAGLSLSRQESDGSISEIGLLGLPGSINDVDAGGDYIVAASGAAGIIVIKCNEPDPSLMARCEDIPEYGDDPDLVIGEDESLQFKGSYQFSSIKNNGELLLCGAWTSLGIVHVNPESLFEIMGMMIVGNNNQSKNLIIKENSVFRLEGDLTVHGNLILQDNATLECIGPDNRIDVHGNVNIGEDVTITGTFEDVQDKF